MRFVKEIKRDTQIIILSVAILTIVTLSVSYSAFFSVQSLSTIQEISTGTLNVAVTVDNSNSILNEEEELFPSTVEEITSDESGKYSILNLLNEGDLDADFSVTIGYDFEKLREITEFADKTDEELLENLVSFEYLNIGIYDEITGEWVNFDTSESGGENFYPAISGLVPTAADPNVYPILRSSISALKEGETAGTQSNQKRYRIYIWLADDTPSSQVGLYAYLKLNVKCAAGNETITETVESSIG